MKKVITAQDLQEVRKAGLTAISVPPGALVTPQAQDDARNYGIVLQREPAVSVAAQTAVAVPAAPQAFPANIPQGHGSAVAGSLAVREIQAVRNLMAAVVPTTNNTQPPAPPAPPTAIPAEFVAELISRQVAQHLGNVADMARINAAVQDVLSEYGVSAPARAAQSATQSPVQSGNGAVLVRGRDALPANGPGGSAVVGAVIVTDSLIPDAQGPGIGYLQFVDNSFEWTFTTDEVLLVLEGELRLSGAGLDLKAGPGDALRLSAGLSCTLTATGRVSCVYSAWPK